MQGIIPNEHVPIVLQKSGKKDALEGTVQIELGLPSFLEEDRFMAFTGTFENFGGLKQF